MEAATIDTRGLLHAILTCVTAGSGLGFNRAALFLADEGETQLTAVMAIGPATSEEAHRTWARLAGEDSSLDELLRRPPHVGPRSGFEARVEGLSIPLAPRAQSHADGADAPAAGRDNPMLDAYRNRRVVRVTDAASRNALPQAVREGFGGAEVVCVPLVAKARSIGVIVADNAFTGEPIPEERIQLLALLAGLALDNARIYEQSQRQAAQLRETLAELQTAQEGLVRCERLATVGEVVARVSHEIRNPLSTIGGFASRLSAAPEDTARVRRNAGIIVAEVEKLEQLLKEMLDLTSTRPPVRAPMSLNRLVVAMADLYRAELVERGISLDMELTADVPDLVLDAHQIQRVLLNLWRNAVEAMADAPSDGVKTLRIATAGNGEAVRLTVADTGIGMAADVVARIFTPFFTTKRHGSGLGLAVVKKVVDDHHGEIHVDTAPGRGAAFVVTLPIAR